MLSFFPARDVDEPVTKDFLRAEISDLRTEIQRQANKLLIWLMATIIAVAGIAVTVTVTLTR
jgi:hypothetical protein